MKAAILQNEGGFIFEDVPRPQPGPEEALVRVQVCGVCTSDMGVWKRGMGRPEILGHEVVGVIEAVGDAVEGWQAGQRVTGAIMKGYAEYAVTGAKNLIAVPDALQSHEAIVEPLSCLMSGIRRAGVGLGDRAAVVGAGFMGLAMLQLLKLAGATGLTAIDVRPDALRRAAEFGAAELLSPDEARERYGREGLPLVIEAAGAAAALELAGQISARHGTLEIVGYHPCRRDVDMALWNGKALTVINAFEYRKAVQLQNMRAALELTASGAFPLGRLLTHSFAFGELTRAFEAHERKEDGYLKSYVRIS
jgi:threonine dehydrogenase-like Zn-dependent dehydrogenase